MSDTTATSAVVALDHVTVTYGRNTALNDVSAAFPPGAVGLLGPNGAGKSTMLRSLLGFIVPTTGRMTVLGLDVATRGLEIRAKVGYMPETDGYVPGMNAVSFVAYCGRLAGLPAVDAMQRAHEVLYYVGLGEARYRKIETYSTGMKQRIKLAQALVHDPSLLFLDEPTNGMDPKGREEMLELVRDLSHGKGINVILSSHLLPDVDFVCDHVIVLDKARVAAQGRIDELKRTMAHVVVLDQAPVDPAPPQEVSPSAAPVPPVAAPPPVTGRVFELRIKGEEPVFIRALRQAGLDCRLTDDEDVMHLVVPEGTDVQRVFAVAVREGVQVRHLQPSQLTLEDVFARAVGEE